MREDVAFGPTGARVDFGIITIREDELAAVLQRLPDQIRTVEGHRIYRLRRLQLSATESYTVAVVHCAEQGNGEAQAAARDLIEDLAPAWILIVGIAAGVPADEFSLGDVVVSNRIHDFSVEAVLNDHTREYALAGGPLHPDAASRVADIPAMVKDDELRGWNEEAAIGERLPPVEVAEDRFYGDDRNDVREKIVRRFVTGQKRLPRVTTGAIASSDRLIKDYEILGVWRTVARQVIAVEMESAGVYRAAHGRQVPFLSIRGISDVVGFRRDPAWTSYACHTAAAFMLAFLRARPLRRLPDRSRDAISGRHEDGEKMAYPNASLNSSNTIRPVTNTNTNSNNSNNNIHIDVKTDSTPWKLILAAGIVVMAGVIGVRVFGKDESPREPVKPPVNSTTQPVKQPDGGAPKLVKIPSTAIRVTASAKSLDERKYAPANLFDDDQATGWCVAETVEQRFVEVFVANPYQVTRVIVQGGWPYISEEAKRYRDGGTGDMWELSLIVTKATVSWNRVQNSVSFTRANDRENPKPIEIPPNAGPIRVWMDKLDHGTPNTTRSACWGEVELWGYEVQ